MSTENTEKRLQELGGSDYEIADGQPDIRGWDVKDSSDKKIGKVDELIFDVQSRKVRYIVLNLKGNVLDLDARDVLVPIGIAQLDGKDDDVVLSNVTAEQLRSLPEYDKDTLTSDIESKIRTVFCGAGGAFTGTALEGTGTDNDFYNHSHFDDNNLYKNRKGDTSETTTIPVIQEELQVGKREVEKGGLRLKSRIVETPVEESINLRSETVQVERTPVDRLASASDLKEEQYEIIERAEVPVVSKEARVVEEVSLNKEVIENEQTISDTVRKTEVDIDRTTGKDDDIVSGDINRI